MVIDTSALVAILQNEPERRRFNQAIEEAESCSISSATSVETSIIIESRYGPLGLGDLDLLISKAEIAVVPLDLDQALIARQAFKPIRQGTPSSRPELWRLFQLRAGQVFRAVAASERRRLRPDRPHNPHGGVGR